MKGGSAIGFTLGFMMGAMLAIIIMSARANAQEHMHPTGPAADWYENNCCHQNHCHPVADGVVQDKDEGVFVKGYGVMSYGDPRLRWSRDNGDHVCEDKGGAGQPPKLLCVYRRFKGT